jgi:2-polyprenyl-3-methyl-5-hydroxy-6-metoxy-1,4-benzoquinol methylase
MTQLTRDEQERLWQDNESSFKGDEVAGPVLRLHRRLLGRRALDVGAGSGALMRTYRRLRPGADVVGIDLVPRAPEVQAGDCTALSFPDASFDTVTCTDVIEHLGDEDLDRCLSEIARVLRPGGHAIFSTLDREDLEDATATCPDCGRRFHRWGHCQVFSAERVRALMPRHGLHVVSLHRTHLGLRARAPRLSALFYAFGLDRLVGLRGLTRDLLFACERR